jgi:hypothetical protein
MATAPLSPNPKANQTGNHWPDNSGEFSTVTRASTKPTYMPTKPVIEVSKDLIPEANSLISLTKPGVYEGEIPTIRPVFLGLRSRLLERRISKVQDRIEELSQQPHSKHEEVSRYVGKSILTNKGYWPHSENLRPHSARRYKTARRLEKLVAGRKKNVGIAHGTARLYGADLSEAFEPDFDGNNSYPTISERIDTRRHSATYRKNVRIAGRRNQKFADTISPLYALSRKRNKLTLRRQTIENMRNGRPLDWREALPPKGSELVQYGSPDARHKVALGFEFSKPGTLLNIDELAPSKDKTAEAVIYVEGGSTLYLRGNAMYSWAHDDAGKLVLNRQILAKDKIRGGLVPVLKLGASWPAHHVISVPKGPIRAIIVSAGNMGSGLATDKALRHRANNPFTSARQIARHIDERIDS